MMKGTKPTVLVVEDDEPIRNLIVTTLEMEKYKFDTGADPQFNCDDFGDGKI